ncbi:hypothetical protein KVR01_003364 [Diaporthe batatas]|uniref:uncharacterized protein n=1 Tax=Diaporthe batatas TaxID=748121 RepID=UPI001D039CD8|nr:uncharacterized protein KVR01_003364 [Diaporthe batatas]KAG8167675.1 hypothetical protein KVR01_003364 [Diaporthe batatas]
MASSSLSALMRSCKSARPCLSQLSSASRNQARLCRRSSTAAGSLPLQGYRVLDMTRVLAGPYCTQILGDLGAEVIKIEHPVRGDDTRAWGPPYAKYRDGSEHKGPGESAYFLGVNRNKKSLGLSFQDPAGVDILHKLAAKCDILVENYIPGALKKYGLDFDTIHKINPALIYASITGYGQSGPYSQRAGYDVMVEAEFGLMHITGARDGPPVKVGVAVTDLTTGLYTSNSIMAALLGRQKSGKGQHLDIALSDCQTATLANIASSCLISGDKDTGRWGTAHPSIVPYKAFKTKDGDVLFGGGNDRLFGILCDGLGKPEWKDDPKFKINSQRVANRDELEAEIENISTQKTTKEWLDVFEGKGMPYAAVNDVQGTLNHEHTLARNMVIEVDHGDCGPIKLVNTPMKFSESKPGLRSPPPTLGQHTDEGNIPRTKTMADPNLTTGTSVPADDAGDGKGTTPAAPPSAAANASPALASRSASPYVSDGSRRFSSPYTPQFSPATQMILKRMRGEAGGLSSALASATAPGAPRPSFPRPVYESVRERIVAMKSALTSGSNARQTGAVGQKRKRARGDGDISDVSSLAEGSDYGEGIKKAKPKQATTPQITQSGRRILKPDTYDPAAEDNAKKNARLGKRTTEQALCKKCTRMHSPATNQMVFCDGCNDPWHQRCHDPWIEDEITKDQNLKWYCVICQAKRERLQPKKKVEQPRFGSWADRPASQKRAYLSALSPEDLVNIILHATELHPDLPIFPIESTSTPKKLPAGSSPRSLFAGASAGGLFHRAETNPTAPLNFIRKIPANAKKSTLAKARSGTGSLQSKTAAQASALAAGNHVYDEEESSFTKLWPRPGKGMYSRLPPEADDDRGLTDDNDHAAFSVIVFNEKGKKIEENGVKV